MQNPFERCLEAVLTPPFYLGQLLARKTPSTGGFVLSHRDDELLEQLQTFQDEQDAIEIAKYDDAGNYRPLKTAPNMRHGWRLNLATIEELRRALDYFYPGRLAVFAAWKSDNLQTTLVARYAGAAIRHVSRRSQNFRSADQRCRCAFLPI